MLKFVITSIVLGSLFYEDLETVSVLKLASIDYEQGGAIPDEIQKLDGKNIRLEGFMDLNTPEGVAEFRLTYDSCGCDGAKLHHFVDVTLDSETVGYRPGKVTVVGTISVGEVEEDGFVTSLYRFDAEKIE